ncbi:MAG: NAD+ synthase [Candidatus Omnitrophica bacterium]|nr:NAD+ synthase [Candidatus Omnitrophota bacterium]
MRTETKLEVGLAQINPTVGDFQGNREKICSYIDAAEEAELDLVVFPELAVSGYPVWDLANKKRFVLEGLKSLALIVRTTKRKRVTVVVGFIDLAAEKRGKNYNAVAVIRNGRIIQKQYKTLLPTYDVFLEEIFFAPARKHSLFSLRGISVGTTICEDIWDDPYPVKPAQLLAKRGAKLLINVSASPYHREALARRKATVLRKAKAYGLPVIYVNQVGGQDDLIFDGRSFVCNSKGQICFQAAAFKEGLFPVSIDLNSSARRPQTSLRSAGTDDVQEMYEALILGLRDYIRKNRFKKVVIGISGGIDSALVATLAADALEPESVIGVSLPGPYSSQHSLKDARALAQNLGIEYRVVSIRQPYARFIREAISDKRRRKVAPVEKKSITVAMENLQARLRAIELMYLSNDEGALLLTTGNKSELAMGYSTLYGDMCGGLSVLGDVYKTDVYRIAHYRNSLGKVIPDSTLRKAPSAELRPNQKDRDSLPPYSILDQILRHYIERNMSFDEIIKALAAKRISAGMVRRVLRMVDHNEYKRRQLPPSLRITQKAWFGRRMPITNRFES